MYYLIEIVNIAPIWDMKIRSANMKYYFPIFRKGYQHTRGKWLIHDTKHHKDN